MSGSPEEFHLLPAVETASKYAGISIGAIYLVGFLVVAAHLSRYGVSSFSVLQLQYLIAGIWVLGLPGMYFGLSYTANQFGERATPSTGSSYTWRRLLISLILGNIPIGVFLALLAAIPYFLQDITWGIVIRLLLFFSATIFSGHLLWQSSCVPPEQETWLVNRRNAAPFHLSLLICIVLAYVAWFGVRIYPLIPSSLGGGRPLTIVFIGGEKRLPDEIKEDPKLRRSIPYKLLVATDKFYVVLSPNQGEKSIEVSRDSVAGIIVLEDSHAP